VITGPFTVPDRNQGLINAVESLRPATLAGQAKGSTVGRHSAPRVTFRNAAIITAASAGLAMALTGTASADPGLESCFDTPNRTNPDIHLCQDHGYSDGYDALHAIVKIDPLLCAHVVVDPEGHRRLVGTRSCEHHRTPPVVVEPCPPCPPGTPPAAVPCPVPVPVAPVIPVAPVGPGSGGTTIPVSDSPPVVEAPAPTTVVGGPIVTH
jgi:hypothetical protein